MHYLRNFPTFVIALVLATQVLVSPTANAQTAFKIGFVDPVRLIEQAPQGVKALANLEEEFRSRDEELKVQHDKIQEMEAELEKNILVMDATSAQARQRDIENHKRRLARSQQEAREDYNLRRNEELARLQALVREVIVEIARAGAFDLVVEQAVYVSDAINITDLVLERLAELR
jgi:outer membrane protein